MRPIDWTWWPHHVFGPKWGIRTFCERARSAGAAGIELAPHEHWPVLAEFGLKCPVAILDWGPEPDKAPFLRGWGDPADHEYVETETLRQIGNCAASKGLCGQVIQFSGMKKVSISEPASIGHCVAGIKQVIGAAEKAGVVLLFECLNDKPEGAEDWKGHPGYAATTLDYGIKVVDGVGSPHCKLVVDVYHLQRQEGNVIQNLARAKDHTGHLHVAGIGELVRHEMHVGRQDLNWPHVLGYINDNYPASIGVGIEYIPRDGRRYYDDLRAAMRLIQGQRR